MSSEQTNGQDDSVTLRVVMYGAPSSGKTTTALALGEGFGQSVRTFTGDDDNQYFKWMEYVGGRHEGKPICTQLIAIASGLPAQIRTRLLRVAHVVLFVADTSPAGMEQSIQMFKEIEQVLDSRPDPRPHTIIQANKRDLEDAVGLADFTTQLGIDESQIVVETVATEGSGIRQAFVYAVRVGLEHLTEAGDRTVVDGEDALSSINPNELLTVLEQLRDLPVEGADPKSSTASQEPAKSEGTPESEAEASTGRTEHPEAALRIVERLPMRRENGTNDTAQTNDTANGNGAAPEVAATDGSAADDADDADSAGGAKKQTVQKASTEPSQTDEAQSEESQAKKRPAKNGQAKKGQAKKRPAQKGRAKKDTAPKDTAAKKAAKKAGNNKTAMATSDKATSEKTASDKATSEKTASEKVTAGESKNETTGAASKDTGQKNGAADKDIAENDKTAKNDKAVESDAPSTEGTVPAPPGPESVRSENQPPPPSTADAASGADVEAKEESGTLLTKVKHLMRGS